MTGRWGRINKQLLGDLKEKIRNWKLKEEALDRTMWKTRFGRGYEPVVRQTTEWMKLPPALTRKTLNFATVCVYMHRSIFVSNNIISYTTLSGPCGKAAGASHPLLTLRFSLEGAIPLPHTSVCLASYV
jgi:hypothetical protein